MKHQKFRLSALTIRLLLIFLTLLCAVPFLVVFINSSHSSLDIIKQFNLLPGRTALEQVYGASALLAEIDAR